MLSQRDFGVLKMIRTQSTDLTLNELNRIIRALPYDELKEKLMRHKYTNPSRKYFQLANK